jgi:steroid delta-isomerase-like uncharacterized protein
MMMMRKLMIAICTLLFFLSSCKQKQEGKNIENEVADDTLEQMMITASENYMKAWNENNVVLMQAVTINDVVRSDNGAITSSDQAGIGEIFKYWHTAIPDLKISLDHIVVKDGKSFASWTCTGTNTGKFGDTPPTGKKINTAGFTVLSFNEQAKIITEDAYYDMLGVLEGWGYTLTPPIMK